MVEVIAIEGNGARPSHRGGGYSEDGKMFTLNTIERHVVCFIQRNNTCMNKLENKAKAAYETDGIPQTLSTQE